MTGILVFIKIKHRESIASFREKGRSILMLLLLTKYQELYWKSKKGKSILLCCKDNNCWRSVLPQYWSTDFGKKLIYQLFVKAKRKKIMNGVLKQP